MTNALSGSYERRIERALQTLPRHSDSPIFADPGLKVFKELSDYEPLPLINPSSTNRNARPGQVLTEDPSEFPAVFALLKEMTGMQIYTDPDYFVRHERQHGEACQKLGGAGLYGLNLHADNEGRAQLSGAFHRCLDLRTDKLGLALTYAHPYEGLDADLKDVEAMGYRGIWQLGELAMQRNSELGECRYPVPMSYSSGKSDAKFTALSRSELGPKSLMHEYGFQEVMYQAVKAPELY